jgi:hypothetical protein
MPHRQPPTNATLRDASLQAKGGYTAAAYGFDQQQDEPEPETESEEEVGNKRRRCRAHFLPHCAETSLADGNSLDCSFLRMRWT